MEGFFILEKKMKQKTKYIFSAIFVIIAVVLAVFATRSCSKQKTIEHTVEIHDTIVNVSWDTVVEKQKEYVFLKTTDSLYIVKDSVLVLVDSVQVEIPISEYRTEKVFENDSSELKIGLTASGYQVHLDTLYYDLTYRYTTMQPPKKRNRLGIMVGVMGGAGVDPTNGRIVPAVGVGVGIGITTKKW